MRSRKSSDSPSGATRDVYPLRSLSDARHRINQADAQVFARALDLLHDHPGLATEAPFGLMSRMRGDSLAYEDVLTRAAMGVLLVAAVDRAESMDVTSGGDHAA